MDRNACASAGRNGDGLDLVTLSGSFKPGRDERPTDRHGLDARSGIAWFSGHALGSVRCSGGRWGQCDRNGRDHLRRHGGAMLLLSGSSSRQASDGELLASVPMAWPAVGVVILLTAASAKVPHLVGLIVCAIALVLLWINSMPADSRRDHEASVPDPHAGYLAATLVLGLLLAACAWLATPWIPAIVLTVISLTGLALVMLVTSHRGASQGIQAAGWLAILLPCLGLGLLGHDQLFEMIQAGTSSAVPRLHETIGLLGPGLIILVTTLVIRGSRDWSPLWRWYSGLGLFLVGILTGGLAVRGLLS